MNILIRKSIFRFLVLSFFIIPTAFSQKMPELRPLNDRTDVQKRIFTIEEMNQFESLSEEYSGLSKVFKVDNTPALYYSKTDFWPKGAWGRGYATEVNAKNFYEKIPGKYDIYYSAHPLIRVNHRYLTAHLYNYLAGVNKEKNLEKIKAGIDNLLEEQRADGMFTWWYKRQTQINMSSSDYKNAGGETVTLNKGDDYETSYGLNALTEFYNSGIDYRRTEVLEAIKKAETGLVKISNFNENTNNNFRGLGLWALCGSYRITKNKLAIEKIRNISKKIISEQSDDGQWRTGGQDKFDYDGKSYLLYHDQKIFYHFMTLRGLVEASDVVERTMLKRKIVKAVKLAVNHITDHRASRKTTGFLYAYDLEDPQSPKKETFYLDSPSWFAFSEPYTTMETLLRLTSFAKESKLYNKEEEKILESYSNTVAGWIKPEKDHFRPAAMYNFYTRYW